MIERLSFLLPEIALFVTTCVVMVLGLSRSLAFRKACSPVAMIGLAIAAYLAYTSTPTGEQVSAKAGQLLLAWMPAYAKVLICLVSIPLLLLLAGTVDREEEARIASGRGVFEALRSNRAEFYAFFLFSITGLLLCASADDLIWLFLALELTSLPTYIMVTISSKRNASHEAGVKYFFLGALGAAVFLYGFSLIYGGTGSTNLNAIAAQIASGGLNTITLAGVLMALLGLCFKIAAVPMHFYTADVYQGAAPQVSAMLAFVPKTAGFISMMLLLAAVGWSFGPGAYQDGRFIAGTGGALPEPIRLLLWVIAALTMTVGNVLAVLQSSVKRMLAYSSIAHSGYMLVGLVVGPGDGSFANSGLSAVLFYLMSYGVMNVGAFAVLASLERSPAAGDDQPREIDRVEDLRGLWSAHPVLAVIMSVSALSLLGLPPLLGFFGKVPLFTSAINAGEIPLVIVLGLNSAIAAFYYLRLVVLPYLSDPDATAEPMRSAPYAARSVAGLISVVGVIALAFVGNHVATKAQEAGTLRPAGTAVPSAGVPEIKPTPPASVARAD